MTSVGADRKLDCRVKKLVNRTVWGDLLFPVCRSRTLRLRQRARFETRDDDDDDDGHLFSTPATTTGAPSIDYGRR